MARSLYLSQGTPDEGADAMNVLDQEIMADGIGTDLTLRDLSTGGSQGPAGPDGPRGPAGADGADVTIETDATSIFDPADSDATKISKFVAKVKELMLADGPQRLYFPSAFENPAEPGNLDPVSGAFDLPTPAAPYEYDFSFIQGVDAPPGQDPATWNGDLDAQFEMRGSVLHRKTIDFGDTNTLGFVFNTFANNVRGVVFKDMGFWRGRGHIRLGTETYGFKFINTLQAQTKVNLGASYALKIDGGVHHTMIGHQFQHIGGDCLYNNGNVQGTTWTVGEDVGAIYCAGGVLNVNGMDVRAAGRSKIDPADDGFFVVTKNANVNVTNITTISSSALKGSLVWISDDDPGSNGVTVDISHSSTIHIEGDKVINGDAATADGTGIRRLHINYCSISKTTAGQGTWSHLDVAAEDRNAYCADFNFLSAIDPPTLPWRQDLYGIETIDVINQFGLEVVAGQIVIPTAVWDDVFAARDKMNHYRFRHVDGAVWRVAENHERTAGNFWLDFDDDAMIDTANIDDDLFRLTKAGGLSFDPVWKITGGRWDTYNMKNSTTMGWTAEYPPRDPGVSAVNDVFSFRGRFDTVFVKGVKIFAGRDPRSASYVAADDHWEKGGGDSGIFYEDGRRVILDDIEGHSIRDELIYTSTGTGDQAYDQVSITNINIQHCLKGITVKRLAKNVTIAHVKAFNTPRVLEFSEIGGTMDPTQVTVTDITAEQYWQIIEMDEITRVTGSLITGIDYGPLLANGAKATAIFNSDGAILRIDGCSDIVFTNVNAYGTQALYSAAGDWSNYVDIIGSTRCMISTGFVEGIGAIGGETDGTSSNNSILDIHPINLNDATVPTEQTGSTIRTLPDTPPGANATTPVISYSFPGELIVDDASTAVRLYIPATGTLTMSYASAGVAPTGAAINGEMYKNGAALGTPATFTIAAAANTGTWSNATGIAVAAGDYLTFPITQVGSTDPGSNVSVQGLLTVT